MGLAAGALSIVSVTSTSDSLSSAAATGGTSPYTYQWYRSQTSGFTPGSANAVAAATALTLNDSALLTGQTYFYKVISTDSASTPATVTSAELEVDLVSQNDLSLANIINISVSQAQTGIGAYNTSNTAIFTKETAGSGFGNLGYKIYLDPTGVATDFGSSSNTYLMALQIFSQQPNILAGNGYLVVIPMGTDTIVQAINRTVGLVQYFGILVAEITTSANMLAAAAVVQTLNKIAFWPSRFSADVAPGGMLDLLRSGDFHQSRGLYYGASSDALALQMAASYVGRALSTDFAGVNTTETMHLKDLIGVQPDRSLDQTLLNQCITAGVDVYANLQGVQKVFTSGANQFFDDVYNLQWFVGALDVAGFNFLAQSSTKIPQTEDGMTAFKNAYRQVCEQAVGNQFLAPGVWNNPTTFGNQSDLLQNVIQRGYYIFSVPLALQSVADRQARKAPLVQLAIKYAGAVQSASVIVYVNA